MLGGSVGIGSQSRLVFLMTVPPCRVGHHGPHEKTLLLSDVSVCLPLAPRRRDATVEPERHSFPEQNPPLTFL